MLCEGYVHRVVFITLHSQLRRHRRKAVAGMAVLAVAAVAMTARSAVMASGGDHMSGAASVCLVVGGCMAVIAVAAFAVRWLLVAGASAVVDCGAERRGTALRSHRYGLSRPRRASLSVAGLPALSLVRLRAL
jgi:hypothetical protein